MGCAGSAPLFLCSLAPPLAPSWRRRGCVAAAVAVVVVDRAASAPNPVKGRRLCRTRGAWGSRRGAKGKRGHPSARARFLRHRGLSTTWAERRQERPRASGRQRRGRARGRSHGRATTARRAGGRVRGVARNCLRAPPTPPARVGQAGQSCAGSGAISTWGVEGSAACRARLHCRHHGRTTGQGASVRVPRHRQPRPAGRPVRTAPAPLPCHAVLGAPLICANVAPRRRTPAGAW